MIHSEIQIGFARMRPRLLPVALGILLVFLADPLWAQNNNVPSTHPADEIPNSPPGQTDLPTAQFPPVAKSAGELRWDCIQNRRIICGKILKELPDGLVVDSGYTNLLRPPLNRSWLVPGAVQARPAANLVEGNQTDSVCIGLVFLSDPPKKPVAKLYDYVNLEGFPAGQCTYTSVGGVQRTVRRFSSKLEQAVLWKLEVNGTTPRTESGENYDIYVSNERSDNVSVIDGATREVVATIPVGKRPRGIHLSPDGSTVFVAVSGTPVEPPPMLDTNGNPIFQKGHDDDDENKNADKAADGIVIIDVAQRKKVGKLPAGSDPEQFAVSADGARLFISNEDVGTASVLNIASARVEKIIPVHKEPEGAGVRPDGKVFYITCETDGEIFSVDASTFKVINHFNVGGRPRSVDFLPDGTRAFIPSESAGELHVIDSVNHQPLETIALPKGSRPMCVKVSPDGKKVYAGAGRAGTICVVDAQSHQVLKSIKAGTRPWGIIISPDGKFLYSANGPSNDISVIDLATETEVQRIKAGASPWGILLVPKR